MPKEVIIFNGPPGSGKDEACKAVTRAFENSKHLEFKRKLFELTMLLFHVTEKEFFELYNDRKLKEQKTCLLGGMSPREAMIFVSEEVVKPNFGKQYFGEVAADDLIHGLNVFSDGGFVEELGPVYQECEGRMCIIQIHRDGYDYSNDSRSYVNSFADALIIRIHNDSSLEIFHQRVFKTVEAFAHYLENGEEFFDV